MHDFPKHNLLVLVSKRHKGRDAPAVSIEHHAESGELLANRSLIVNLATDALARKALDLFN